MQDVQEERLWAIANDVLTVNQLEVCRMVWLRGLSQRQTADLLGLSRSAVRDRLRAATKRMSDHLTQKAA